MGNSQSTDEELDEAGVVVRDDHAARRLKVIRRTSASQISSFEACPRIWFNSSILGDRAPQSPAQAKGQTIDDDYVQAYLRTGEVPAGDWHDLAVKMVALLPDRSGDLLVQHEVQVPTYDGGPFLIGYPDVMVATRTERPGPEVIVGSDGLVHLRIDDTKTTSDFRYAKTADELASDVQMISYARWGYEVLGADSVEVAHVYGRTKAPARAHRSQRPHPYDGARPCKCGDCSAWQHAVNSGKPLPSTGVHLTREQVTAAWAEKVEVVREMVRHARETRTADDLVPNTSRCDAYGGCYYRSKCGFSTTTKHTGEVFKMAISTDGSGSSLMDRLRKKNGAASPPPATEGAPPPASWDALRAKIARGDLKRDGRTNNVFDKEGADDGYILRKGTPEELAALADPPGMTAAATGAVAIRPDHVVPPDAPPRESTPEEVAAASAPKGKKGKDPKPEKVIHIKCPTCEQKVPPKDFGEHFSSCLVAAAEPAQGSLPVEQKAPVGQVDLAQPGGGGAGQVSFHTMPPEARPEQVAAAAKAKPATSASDVEKEDHGAELARLLAEKRTSARKVPPVKPVLYIDCFPTKGAPVAPTSLEDWLSPIAELAAVAHDVADYRMISYTSKGVLATAIQACLDTCPAALVIDSRQAGADEVLAALVPHAALVVRGIR